MSLAAFDALAAHLSNWSHAIAGPRTSRTPARSPRRGPIVHDTSLPLTMVGAGGRGRLAAITASPTLARRLADLGLTPGVLLEVMRDDGGPLLLAVRETRLALGRAMAQHIVVHLDEQER